MDIRNVAIIAHVDHGKTTLVDGMLRLGGLFRANQKVETCILDSNDLERERGITILAKNVSVRYGDTKINIIDTPGHSDFGGEVERVLKMATGVLLLVDAADGPMPQTRFVLRKALELNLKAVVVINKIDRPEARPYEVLDEVFELFLALGASTEQLDFPTIYASGREGFARYDVNDGNTDLVPLFDTIIKHIPAPPDDPTIPFRMLVTSILHSEFTGRMAVGRIFGGILKPGMRVLDVKRDGSKIAGTAKRLHAFEGLKRAEVPEMAAGDIVAVEGLPQIEIGDTICDAENYFQISVPPVEEPTISMLFTVNDSPFAGQEGEFVTSRHLRDRLMRELERDVALRVNDTDRAETLRVSGRGVLHLGILIENMRREGFEFAVGKPRVIVREIDGEKHEPIETLVVDSPEANAGRVIEEVGRRRGELVHMDNKQGLVNMEFTIPARGLIGLKTRLMNLTQGEATMSHIFLRYEPFKGSIPHRTNGVQIASDDGEGVAYALFNLKDRGTFFIGPGTPVYVGMIVGEHCKENDIVVNVCKEKKLTNMRASGSDKKLLLSPPTTFTLEEALEYIEDDELVEVTPKSIRLRKAALDPKQRKRSEPAGV